MSYYISEFQTHEQFAQANEYFDQLRTDRATYSTFSEYREYILDVRTQPGSQYDALRQVLREARRARAAVEGQLSSPEVDGEAAVRISETDSLGDIRSQVNATLDKVPQPEAVAVAKKL